MQLNPRTLFLLSAFACAPFSLRGQSDPNAMPAGAQPTAQPGASNHATTPGTVSGTTLAAQDSSANGGVADAGRMKDKIFLRKASEGGMADVQMGQLAANKAGSDEVKKFAQKMVDDHSSLNDQLGPIAVEMGVKAPARLNKMDQAEYDKLNGLAGADFDKEYLTAMTQAHRKDLRDFKQEEGSATDPVLKDTVGQAEKMIGGHLVMLEKLDAANGVAVASTPQ